MKLAPRVFPTETFGVVPTETFGFHLPISASPSARHEIRKQADLFILCKLLLVEILPVLHLLQLHVFDLLLVIPGLIRVPAFPSALTSRAAASQGHCNSEI